MHQEFSLKKSADMEDVRGMIEVGNCYRKGIGVVRDIQRANYWYRKGRNIKKINIHGSQEGLDNDGLKKPYAI
ncbi:142_t:CDS:2 [Racocetra persica]|uniref:142_t:CDS:1 n=1 Tax=Racocetra persica TaxID=160502 RepID=A0ACA9LJJ3_9GLOM|nr:142_t:CDS:2 [Racocetra persica]